MDQRAARKVLLSALERGIVSAEDVLREATRAPALRAWVELQRARWEADSVHRASVRRRRSYPAGVARAAVAKARRIHGEKSGVLSVHWGLMREEGRSTAHPGVVVMVERKLPLELLPRRQRIKPTLPIRFGGRAYEIRVDVHATGRRGAFQQEHANALRSGNHASVEVGGLIGALGAFYDAGGALHAVLSGHVAKREGPAAVATALGGRRVPLGTVRQVVLGPRGDVAFSGPVDPADAAEVSPEVVGIRDLDEDDLNVAIRVHVARDVSPRRAFVTDVDVTVPFSYEDGVRRIPGLIAVSHEVSQRGDSGAPAVDFKGNVVGFVVGSLDGHTYLMPARRALDVLET